MSVQQARESIARGESFAKDIQKEFAKSPTLEEIAESVIHMSEENGNAAKIRFTKKYRKQRSHQSKTPNRRFKSGSTPLGTRMPPFLFWCRADIALTR